MKDPKDPLKDPFEMTPEAMLLSMKVSLYTNIGWGALALFFVVGNCANGGTTAAAGLIITAVIYTIVDILQKAWQSIKILKMMKNGFNPVDPLGLMDLKKEAPPKVEEKKEETDDRQD